VFALAFVDIGRRGAEAPEGLQAQLAVDDLEILVLRLLQKAAEFREGAEGIRALRPCARCLASFPETRS
jgi:hypothetical protein